MSKNEKSQITDDFNKFFEKKKKQGALCQPISYWFSAGWIAGKSLNVNTQKLNEDEKNKLKHLKRK